VIAARDSDDLLVEEFGGRPGPTGCSRVLGGGSGGSGCGEDVLGDIAGRTDRDEGPGCIDNGR